MRDRRICLAALGFCLLGTNGAVGARADGPAPAAGGPQALDAFFKGAVVGLSGTKVRLRYDFSDAAQMKDWTEGVPWPIAHDAGDGISVSEGRLSVRGSTGATHVAEWDGDLAITFKLIPDGTKDIGGFLDDPDTPTDYAIFTIAETYFHGWDNKPGGDTGMSKFGKQWATAKGASAGFRYMTYRRLAQEPTPGRAIAFAFGRKGGKDFLTVDDLDIESTEPGNRMKLVLPGFYAIKSSMSVDDVVLEGTLAPRWLEAKKVALRTDKPIPADAGGAAVALDTAVQAMLDAYQQGKESPTSLVKVVGDSARSDAERDAAAAALKAGPRRALPAVIDLLYAADSGVRGQGIDIVKAMTGKNYGFDPKASEKVRGAAIQRLQKEIQDHPELLQGQAVK